MNHIVIQLDLYEEAEQKFINTIFNRALNRARQAERAIELSSMDRLRRNVSILFLLFDVTIGIELA